MYVPCYMNTPLDVPGTVVVIIVSADTCFLSLFTGFDMFTQKFCMYFVSHIFLEIIDLLDYITGIGNGGNFWLHSLKPEVEIT